MSHFAGIVLCGGQSSRMGRSKAWLPVGAEAMLPRVVRLLSSVAAPIIVVAAPGQDLPALPKDVVVVHDSERERGPLQGLAAGLEAISCVSGAAYVSSCDVPFFQAAFAQRMMELLGDHQIAVPEVDGYRHTLAAVYRVDVLAEVQRLLAENRLRPAFLFDRVPTRFVTAAELIPVDPKLQTLRNVNTPEEYEAALRDLDLA